MRAFLTFLAVVLFAATSAFAVPPGSGNWGGGPGNSGPGDKNGQNEQGGGGQTPPGLDKLFEPAPEFVIATHTGDHESPTDRDNGGGNDPNGKAPGQTTNPNPGK